MPLLSSEEKNAYRPYLHEEAIDEGLADVDVVVLAVEIRAGPS